jgi:hypothetical protein
MGVEALFLDSSVMRHLSGVQIAETDILASALPDTKSGLFTKELSFFLLALAGFGAMVALLCMTGCGQQSGGFAQAAKAPAQAAAVVMSPIMGNVRTGASASSGSRVYLLEEGNGGATKSLLEQTVEGASLDASSDQTQGMYAVMADALGQFAIRGPVSCDEGAPVYLYIAGATKALGACSSAAFGHAQSGITVDTASTQNQGLL